MITCEQLFEIFNKNGINFFTGVPDSTFKDWMTFLADEHEKRLTNRIAPSECEAIAFASGYNVSTGNIPIVYMQNSGLGKCVNPLTSLADKEVYSIPMVLMIGWRGEPGKHDEPQHKKMGRITLPLLETLEIPHQVLPQDLGEIEKIITEMTQKARSTSSPVAIVVNSDTLEKYKSSRLPQKRYEMTREEALSLVAGSLRRSDIVVSTTGKCSRELYEFRERNNQAQRDFLQVGSMGCCASQAFEIACQKKDKRVFAFDGDGAVLMQLGALSTIGNCHPSNFYHIVFDNESYESTGEQPSLSSTVNLPRVALACGYESSFQVSDKYELTETLKVLDKIKGPYMLVIKCNPGSRQDLSRPKSTPTENKEAFIKHINS
jgi:phosphonopyruvate decarboxylase